MFCVGAKDEFYTEWREQALRKPLGKQQKELTSRKNPFEIFSSGTAGVLLISEDTRLAVGQAGAAAPWPLNVLPNKAQKAS